MRLSVAILLAASLWPGLVAAAEPEIWTAIDGDGRARDFLLWPGGTVVATGAGGDGRGIRGFWHATKDSRVLMFESGQSAEIGGGRLLLTDGQAERARNRRDQGRPVSRVNDVSARWLGVWIWRRPDSSGTRYVSLVSDGSAFATPGTRGRWIPVTRGVRVEWLDGAIDLLQFDNAAPVLRSWPRGVPTRTNRPQPTRPERVGAGGFLVAP